MTEQPISFVERRRILAEKRAKERGEVLPEPVPEIPAEDIPDVIGERSQTDVEIDKIISNIGIVEAYDRWINGRNGKILDEKTRNRRENIMVSCPNPEHPDAHPSAWMNADNKRWNCGVCNEGGDVLDLAAIGLGYSRPGYKEGKNFVELREKIVEEYGYRIQKEIGGDKTLYQTSTPKESEQKSDNTDNSDKTDTKDKTDKSGQAASSPKTSNVSQMWADDEEDDTVYPEFDWQKVASPNTFLHEYCSATSNDDAPEEYHLFHGFLALAHAVGKHVWLEDTHNVYSNMLVCMLGGTGFGKTRARFWLNEVLRDVVPWKDNGLDCSGVKIVTPPASGEHLIRSFQHVGVDPSLPKGSPVVNNSVNGVVDFDEFASLLSRANRQGSTLKPILMAMADGSRRVATGSLTHGDFIATEPFCSITASTQPKSIRTLIKQYDAGSGFLNRWIFVCGQRKDRDIIGGSWSSVNVDLTTAKELLKDIHAWGSIDREVLLTDDGFEELTRFFRKEVFPIMDTDQTDLLQRLNLLFKRLILIFAINERTTQVDKHIVEIAGKMLTYILRCYAIISSEVGKTILGEIGDRIVFYCKKHEAETGRGASKRDLLRYMRTKNYSPDLIIRGIENCEGLDLIEKDLPTGSKVGRPTTRYKAVNQ